MRQAFAPLSGRAKHLVLGTAVTMAVCLATALLSSWPRWQSVPEGAAILRLSFTHAGAQICRDRTPDELARLPPNMRSRQLCERRRAPVRIEMDVNGATVIAVDRKPSGVAGSGPSRVYERILLPAGSYDVALRLRDNSAATQFTAEARRQITLRPGQNLAIDYRASTGEFIFH